MRATSRTTESVFLMATRSQSSGLVHYIEMDFSDESFDALVDVVREPFLSGEIEYSQARKLLREASRWRVKCDTDVA